MKRKNRGFTLAELLIVVAIIAVLVAISIPIFTSQLEKSREATDLANVRAAYAEVMAAVISEDKNIDFNHDGNIDYSDTDGWFYPVSLKQKKEGWSSVTPITVGGVTSGTDGGDNTDGTWKGYPKANGKCTIYFSNDGVVTFVWDGESNGGTTAPPTVAKDQNNAFLQAVIGDHPGLSYYDGISGSWDSTYNTDKMKNVWKYLKDNAEALEFDAEHIKTWAIINPSTTKASISSLKNDNSNLYYVWSTKDVKAYNIGDSIPVMMSHTDSSGKTTYTVGNVKVTNGDSTSYKIISNGDNAVRPNKDGYDINKLINSTDGKKETFDNYEAAARYYDTLANDS